MKKFSLFVRLLLLLACGLGLLNALVAQPANVERQTISVSHAAGPLRQDERYYHKSQRRVFAQFSAGPANCSPSGVFYEGLDSNVGVVFGARLYQTNAEGETAGFFGGVSFQTASLKYDEFSDYDFYPPRQLVHHGRDNSIYAIAGDFFLS